MGKILAIANNKGGCGKSTTAVNLSAALRLRGYDVLLMDVDGQANATDILRVPTSGGTMFDALKQENAPRLTPVRVLPPENGAGVLYVLPSCVNLSSVEVGLSQTNDGITRLKSYTDKYRDNYDIIVIDTPPAQGNLMFSALYCCDWVLLPLLPQYLHVSGLSAILNTLGQIETLRGVKIPRRVLFTIYDNRKSTHRGTAEQVEGAGVPVFSTRIRENVAIAEAPIIGVDIFRYKPKSNGAEDYGALCSEFVNLYKPRHVNHRYK